MGDEGRQCGLPLGVDMVGGHCLPSGWVTAPRGGWRMEVGEYVAHVEDDEALIGRVRSSDQMTAEVVFPCGAGEPIPHHDLTRVRGVDGDELGLWQELCRSMGRGYTERPPTVASVEYVSQVATGAECPRRDLALPPGGAAVGNVRECGMPDGPAGLAAVYGTAPHCSNVVRLLDAVSEFAERGDVPRGLLPEAIATARRELSAGWRHETETTWSPSSHLSRPDPVERQPEPEPPEGNGWEPFAGGIHDGVLYTRWRRRVQA